MDARRSSSTSPYLQSIDAAYRALAASRAGRLALHRWHTDPALAPMTTLDEVVSAAHPADRERSDKVLAALLQSYQTGDADAAIVICKALAGGIHGRAWESAGSDRDCVDNLASGLGLVLATINSDDGDLYRRILGRLRARYTRPRRRRDATHRVCDPSLYEDDTDPAAAELAGAIHKACEPDPTATAALASIGVTTIHRLVYAAVADGRLTPTAWQRFCAHQPAPVADAPTLSTARVHRYRARRQLQRLLSRADGPDAADAACA